MSKGSLARAILDEIALEGLEGITLSSLFVYLSASVELSLPLSASLQQQVWAFILRASNKLQFYELPEERATVKLYNRFVDVDPYLGVPVTPAECPFPRYRCVPIQDGNIVGSCECYTERKEISIEQLRELSIESVSTTWGNKFVIVGSQQLRHEAITPANVPFPKEFTPIQYCILEAIGRSRFNGETTAGTWSLHHFCRDPTIVFYIKNKLIRQGVIASQPINEKRQERLISGTLLLLPRFYSTYKSVLTTVIEKMFALLKEAPDHRMTLAEVRNHTTAFDSQKSFKKIVMTHFFRRLFETLSLPYDEVHKRTRPKTSPTSKDRTVICIRLRDPNLSMEELFADDSNQEKEDNCEDFYDEKHSFVDMPVKDEFYRAIGRFGSRGCSQSEICTYLSLHHLTVRQIVKKMSREGLIKSYCTDVGRQRINRYVTVEYTDAIKKGKDVCMAVIKNLQCSEEPNIPPKNDVDLADVEMISVRIKPLTYDNYTVARDSTTARQLSRKTLIVRIIDEKCLVPATNLRTAIQSAEKEEGFTDEVCQKSVRRLLYALSQSNIIRTYEILLQYEEQIRIYRYVTHPKIDIDHAILKREVLKLKNDFFLSSEEKRLRSVHQAKQLKRKPTSTTRKAARAAQSIKAKDIMPIQTVKPPKFLISRYMHEFLFYIVVELNEYQAYSEITEEMLQHWQRAEPALAIREYMQQLAVEEPKMIAYSKDISWRTFIPPLPRYADKPAGWVYFMDAVDRMPLSVFKKIFRIEKSADKRLVEYLEHPVRQHYLVRQLPVDLQCQISRIQLQRIYITVLKLLNNMGLVQVSPRQSPKDPMILWVFLNRQSQFLDTTTSDPGYSKINAEREYAKIKFVFSSFDDVHQYWTNLQRVCIYTKLGFRRGKCEKTDRTRELVFTRTVDFDEAPMYDDCQLPGDQLGAAGLSTKLFAHAFRNWSWVLHTNSKPKQVHSGRLALQAAGRTKQGRTINQSHHKYRVHIPPIKRLHLAGGSSGGGGSSATKQRMTAKKSGPRDAIDRDALKNMRTLRVSWRREEDEMLKISRAVYLYVGAPVAALGLLTVGKVCRDIMRHSLGSYNKTSQACVRRVAFLIKQHRHVPEVPSWLNMLQTNETIKLKYGENFLKKLKLYYPNRTEYCDALVLHFIFLMNFVYRLINKDADSNSTTRFIIPDTVAEFHKKFCDRPATADDQAIQHLNPATEFDLQVTQVVSVLHSSLCCSRDKTLYNLQAFEIYKNYSEEVLNAAFRKARSDALIVAVKRKNIGSIPTQLAGPAYRLSSKYCSRLTFSKIPYIVYDSFFGYFKTALGTLFGPSTSSQQPSKRYLELKSPHLGQLFFLTEGLAKNFWQLTVKLPTTILTVDAEKRQTVSPMDRILDHYQSIFENAPQTEYAKNFESEIHEKQVRVKFHPANLSYKIQYSPFDIISKLSTRYLHFFCALDHLQQEVDINFSKLHRRDEENDIVIMECPFSCVLKNANYINAIERIVQEKKTILHELTEMAPQKLLNLATSGSSVTVQTTNLLTLVRMLESFWREKELPAERKDLGKVSSNLKVNKSIDWHQICRDILEFNSNEEEKIKSDDYEPTLNKEERIVRAQDVFVVNLPTLQIKCSSLLCAASEENEPIHYNGLDAVPKELIETEVLRDRILQKVMNDSKWTYTENSFDSLKPRLVELNFNDMERQHLEEVHNFIESHQMGVSVVDLMREFPYEQFLLRAVHTLCEHCLIKRVGVATTMYVHKANIRPWVVHSFHVKRLELENLGGATTSLKRTHANVKGNDNVEDVASKKVKTGEDATKQEPAESLGKRVSKPVKRFADGDEPSTSSKSDVKRDVIVMKPQPWIRLNGSLNRRVLDRYLGAVLTECLSRSGCMILEIWDRFPHMLPVDIMFLLEILSDLKCIHLTQIQSADVDIFAEYEDIKESIVTELYNPELTYVTAHADAVMRMAIFIGNKKYSAEFI